MRRAWGHRLRRLAAGDADADADADVNSGTSADTSAETDADRRHREADDWVIEGMKTRFHRDTIISSASSGALGILCVERAQAHPKVRR